MSKRLYFPQHSGDRKKVKLDVTISDHNFPLSQNGYSKEPEQDNWGDDKDDEILLLASQACEDAYNDLSLLPNYSLCMQPPSTSTQLFDPEPSTSKSTFNFKKPSTIPANVVTSNLKDKINRISSPLPGISTKVLPQKISNVDLTDSLIFTDKVLKGQDSDLLYKQLLQLQEENVKLKSENGKLLEKCVTKEGEASILRSQLKTSQVAVDNARMEKIKAQEKVQMEWMEKLAATNNQMGELRTQLDFKNLEIISIRERCKLLESNKVKLTQVTVPNNDISFSQRCNNSLIAKDTPVRRPKMSTSCIQTEDKSHFLKLNITYRSKPSELTRILPLLMEPTSSQHSLLDYNEKLQKHTDLSQNRCRVYSTFHRIQGRSAGSKVSSSVGVAKLYDELTNVAAGTDDTKTLGNILSVFKSILLEVEGQLELVSRKMTTAFQKEMDERYIEATSGFLVVTEEDLLSGRPLYKEEQGVSARRAAAAVSRVDRPGYLPGCRDQDTSQLIDIVLNICKLLDNTSCAVLYSGLLLAITHLLSRFRKTDDAKLTAILKHLISSRPMTFVCSELLSLLKGQCLLNLGSLCPKNSTGNLRLDYDQGVLLYKKDSCFVQVLLKQVETSLKCIEKQKLTHEAVKMTSSLIALHSGFSSRADCQQPQGCDCQLTLLQVLVYALKIIADMLKNCSNNDASSHARVLAVCRSGVCVLHGLARAGELGSTLAHDEGHLQRFVELMAAERHGQAWASMVQELSSSFQSSPEDCSSAYHQQPWLHSFQNFTITD